MTDFLEERDHGVVIITLNRPDRLNAVTEQFMRDLAARLEAIGKDASVGSVVLTGAGRAFCVGGDIKDMEDNPPPRDFDFRVDRLMAMQRVAVLLRTMPKVTIAAVNGPAMGAGLGMAIACDLRLSARSARFAASF
ncbi:MAG: enoyl-CoA hydratase/isomerase family protein, partial [Parvibaculum sp.]|uniref:enoyl-CoA hydratase/isomerase family protein n=1 Tax=Parvibaculum sp. TaxID=2024848 RepID=UPI001B12BBDC